MRLASWRWGGTDQTGTSSPCGHEALPLRCRDASLVVRPLIGTLARGAPLPLAAGTQLPALELRTRCALPHRNISGDVIENAFR